MAEIIKQFLKVQDFKNWTDEKKDDVNDKGQIVFVPGATRSDDVVDVNAIYAAGSYFGDGALSNKTVLTEGFKVEGGPLSELLKDKGITEIKEGTNLQELLKSLFCVTLWSKNITVTNPSVTVQNVAPKITGVTNNGLYEVGDVINITVALQPMKVTDTPAKISGFEYGYYLYEHDTKNEDATQIVTNNSIEYERGGYAGRYSYSDGSTGSMVDEQTFASTSDVNLSVTNGTVSFTVNTYLGSINKVTAISAYSKGLTYSNDGTESAYELSNLGDIGTYSYNLSSISSYYVKRDDTDKTTTVKWTGVYPIYFEGTQYNGTIPDDEIEIGKFKKCDILKNDGGTLDIYVKFPDQSAANGWKIVIPEVYTNGTTITAKAYNPFSGKYEASKTFVKTDEIKQCESGTSYLKYNGVIYLCNGTDGANGLQLSITL